MLETIMDSYAIFWAMGVIVALDLAGKMIRAIALKRLVKAAGRMGKSTHKLMKLVKAKFEHTYMLSNGVDNIAAFVDKYLHEYKILGLRLQRWRNLEKRTLWLCGILGFAGAVISYRQDGMQEVTFQYLALGATGVVILFLIRISSDERYQLRAARVYMIDYLQNICAPRYEKQQTLQLRRMEATMETTMEAEMQEEAVDVEAEDEEDTEESAQKMKEPGRGPLRELKPEQEERVPQEVILREILEEFLA